MRRELVQDGPHGLHEGLVAAGLHGLPLGHLGRPGRLADLDGPTPLRLSEAHLQLRRTHLSDLLRLLHLLLG